MAEHKKGKRNLKSVSIFAISPISLTIIPRRCSKRKSPQTLGLLSSHVNPSLEAAQITATGVGALEILQWPHRPPPNIHCCGWYSMKSILINSTLLVLFFSFGCTSPPLDCQPHRGVGSFKRQVASLSLQRGR